jgi:hypothetical protein
MLVASGMVMLTRSHLGAKSPPYAFPRMQGYAFATACLHDAAMRLVVVGFSVAHVWQQQSSSAS